MSLPTKRKKEQIKESVRHMDEQKITLEFDNPENLEKAIIQYSEFIEKTQKLENLKNSTFMLLYELDVEKKEIITCSTTVGALHVGASHYGSYVYRHTEYIRYLFNRYPVLDIHGGLMISWTGKKLYDDSNLEGFSYVIPTYVPQGAPPVTLVDEELSSFYDRCQLNDYQIQFLVQQFEYVGPYYATFSVNHDTPVKYGFHAMIRPELLQQYWQPLLERYKRGNNLLALLTECFNQAIVSIQFSTVNFNFFCVEFGIPAEHTDKFIERIIKYKCLDEEQLDVIKQLNVPQFIDNVVFKLRWEDENTQTMKIYMESQNSQHIKDSL